LVAFIFAVIAGYALYRATRRVSTPTTETSETSHYETVLPQASHIALGVAQDIVNDQANAAENSDEES
jgi:hypothetical protein